MKILAGNLKEKNIQMLCKCCNCSYELEDKNDFKVNYIYKPTAHVGICKIMVPQYSIVCPVCGAETYVGIDPRDCNDDYNRLLIRGVYASIIFNRDDWVEKYKSETKLIGENNE